MTLERIEKPVVINSACEVCELEKNIYLSLAWFAALATSPLFAETTPETLHTASSEAFTAYVAGETPNQSCARTMPSRASFVPRLLIQRARLRKYMSIPAPRTRSHNRYSIRAKRMIRLPPRQPGD
jgi:hypothetical protein